MNKVALSISSNVPCGTDAIRTAAAWLSTLLCQFRISSTYSTKSRTATYCNAVAVGTCHNTADQLDQLFKADELAHGRDAKARQEHVTPIDIDIVVFNGTVLREWDFNQQFFKIGWAQLIGSDNQQNTTKE